MKKIKILNKKYTFFQLIVIVATIIFIIGLIIAGINFYSQNSLKKAAEEPLLTAINECREICDRIYAEMDMSENEHFVILKNNIENASTTINKYYATQTLIDYTETLFLTFRSESIMAYQAGDLNDYKETVHQKSLSELQDEFYQKLGNLAKAKANYTSIK